ncbi:hypothetical protein LCGC14_2006660 [marine sediment metagenome]|uniref:Uncharacterized protein n=1 Tax=marine sediment metagenome TaxID=412755 RepID=A0A0F9HYP6_9ZZZZ
MGNSKSGNAIQNRFVILFIELIWLAINLKDILAGIFETQKPVKIKSGFSACLNDYDI